VSHGYTPAWWLKGPHSQTLWPYLFRRRTLPASRPERLTLPDGDFLDLLHAGDGGHGIALVLHGLGGSSQSHYIGGLIEALAGQGWRPVLMHFRGCSGEPNRLARSYHSGETGDLSFVVETLRARFPNEPIFVTGFSLGGNVLLKWLGETGANNPATAAAAISVPFMLGHAARRLDQGFSRVYQTYLLRGLIAATKKKFSARNDAPFKLRDLDRIRTIWQFDEVVTAPLHGFNSAAHYYRESSSRQYLPNIAVPTLILHAKDDPFLPPKAAPTQRELNPTTLLELHETGGHVGFVEAPAAQSAGYYIDRRIPVFFRQVLELEKRKNVRHG